jgi:hypothetical protein
VAGGEVIIKKSLNGPRSKLEGSDALRAYRYESFARGRFPAMNWLRVQVSTPAGMGLARAPVIIEVAESLLIYTV